jgi:hypothetical protein
MSLSRAALPPQRTERNMEEQKKDMKAVWTIVERGQGNGMTKSYWTRVGVGFVNKDGSITLKLDCIPISGTLQVREWEPYERRADAVDGGARPRSKQQLPSGDSLI